MRRTQGQQVPIGLRTIAAYEAVKGMFILVVGMGLLELIHKNVQQLGEELVRHFHLSPSARYPRIFLQLAARLTDTWLWALAAGSLLYASVRFAEAYGLWHERRWAEWLAAVSAGIYVPFEVIEVARKLNWLRAASLVANLLVVAYLLRVLWQSRAALRRHSPRQA